MIPLTRPTLPKFKNCQKKIESVFASGMLTTSRYVAEFEAGCAVYLGVKYVVAVSSGTHALQLALTVLGLTEGEVIIPSFTFTSGGHALLLAGLKPVFADIEPGTYNLDPLDIERKITQKTVAIMPTHVFGNPCRIKEIQAIAKRHNLKIIYDAAHAFGSMYQGKPVATFGDISCFSLTPTKVLTTGEGGLIATNNAELARIARLGRNNGDSFNRDEEFLGLSARMAEIPAIVGLEGLKLCRKNSAERLKRVALYKKLLVAVPGIAFQDITTGNTSTFKDMTIRIDEKAYGHSRDQVLVELKKSSIECKAYFYPPLHQKEVYASSSSSHVQLPITNMVSATIISLPLYSHMPLAEVRAVCRVLKNFSGLRKTHE